LGAPRAPRGQHIVRVGAPHRPDVTAPTHDTRDTSGIVAAREPPFRTTTPKFLNHLLRTSSGWSSKV
jgi:hypothetical protein